MIYWVFQQIYVVKLILKRGESLLITNSEAYLLFSLKKIPTVNEFADYFGIKNNSYMFQIIERLYNYIFNGAFDLLEEYAKYYSQEYLEFEFFLENYYNFIEEEIEKINSEKIFEKHVFYSNLSLKIDYGIQTFLSEEYEETRIREKVYQFFEEYNNEN